MEDLLNSSLLDYFDHTEEFYVVFNLEGEILSANPRFGHLIGNASIMSSDCNFWDFFTDEDREKITKTLETNQDVRKDFQVSTLFFPRRNEQKSIEWNIVVLNQGRFAALGRDETFSLYSSHFIEQAQVYGPMGTWEYEVDTDTLLWSPPVYHIYEISPKGKISLSRVNQFLKKDSLDRFSSLFERLIRSGIPFDSEFDLISGQFRPTKIRMIGRALVREGKATKVFGTIQDITTIRLIEQQSQDYREALDKATIVSILDREGKITHANSKFEEISGYNLEELLGMSHRILDSGIHDDRYWKNMWDIISSGEIWKGEVKYRTKGGQFFWVNATIVPFKNASGRIYQYVHIANDVTENKKLTEEMMVSEKLSSIGEVSAQIIHEVMNPLSIIALNLDMLSPLFDQLNPADSKDAKSIRRYNDLLVACDRINEIFQNMRSILVRKEGQQSGPVNISSVFEKSLSLVRAKLTDKNIEVLNKLSDAEMALCNESDLSQVFINLLNNSIDAISSLNERWIRIDAVNADPVQIQFTDSGKGIPPEIQAKIFENLFTTKGDAKGTGLGMGLCRKLIERHNGSINLDSNAANTRFIIELPACSNGPRK